MRILRPERTSRADHALLATAGKSASQARDSAAQARLGSTDSILVARIARALHAAKIRLTPPRARCRQLCSLRE
jgi:hypothetical protein